MVTEVRLELVEVALVRSFFYIVFAKIFDIELNVTSLGIDGAHR